MSDLADGALPRRSPCASCPYRRDVPSGIWARSQYDALRKYDDTGTDELPSVESFRPFYCHKQTGDLCSGWVGHRDPQDLLALRVGVARGQISPAALHYTTNVPLFKSGAEAADHGMRDIENPSPEAIKMATDIVKHVRGVVIGEDDD